MAQTIIVDITPGYRMPTIYYSQNDVGTQFAIDLRSRFGDSLPASPTVTIQATKPSGFGFSVVADSITNGVATFTTTDEMTDESGRFPAELKVEASGVTLFTANFYMEGEVNTHPAGTIDGQQETVIPELTQLVERVETAASSVLDMTVEAETLAAGSQATYSYDEDTNTATFGIPQGEAGAGAAGVTASAYSSSKTYAVGDYVIHNSNLYRCTTAITTAEAFTAAHWTQVVLGDDVADLKSALNGKIVMESGTWSEADPVSKVTTNQRIRSVDKIKVDSFESITFPTGYTGYGSVMDSTGHRLGFTSNYVSTITQAMIRTRYGSNADTFVFVVRNDSTPNADISSQVSTVTEGTVVKWIEPIKNNGNIVGHISQTADIDTITKEGIWYAPTPNTLTNVPQPFVGSAFILEVLTEDLVTIQKIKNIRYGNIAVRYKVSNDSWSAWANSTDFILITSTDAENVYNSLAENIPCNVFGYITTAWFTDMQSIGTNAFGWIFTYANVLSATNLVLQVFVGSYSNQVFTRAKRENAWTSWQPVNNPTADRSAKYFAFGDSTTYGQIGGGTGQSRYNYPACVGKILDIPVINKAVTNQGLIKDWDTIHTNYITNLDMTGAKLITIGWAYNDYSYYSSMNFGAYTDTGDSTFIGKYYTIMKEFQQKCPDAKIILVTGYGFSNGKVNPVTKPTLVDQFTHNYLFADGNKTTKEMYDELEKMCYLHGWSCVNQAKGTVFNQWNASLLIGDQIHPTNEGYLRYGNYIGAKIASLYANIKAW